MSIPTVQAADFTKIQREIDHLATQFESNHHQGVNTEKLITLQERLDDCLFYGNEIEIAEISLCQGKLDQIKTAFQRSIAPPFLPSPTQPSPSLSTSTRGQPNAKISSGSDLQRSLMAHFFPPSQPDEQPSPSTSTHTQTRLVQQLPTTTTTTTNTQLLTTTTTSTSTGLSLSLSTSTRAQPNGMMSISDIKNTLAKDARIEDGYGEYIVYKAHDKTPLRDKKTYGRCYQVLLQAKQISEESKKQEFLKRELAQIDPAIETLFIPRTLYELCFIEKCAKETLRLGKTCENVKYCRIDAPKPRCWHGAYFLDFGNDQDEIIIDLAYRLNKSVIKNLRSASPGALSYEQITSLANEKLAFLHSCHEASRSKISKQLQESGGFTDGGIMNNMIDESERGLCRPIGIATDKMKELVLNAIALECSTVAKGKLILYRGANISAEKPLEYDAKGRVAFVHSHSYGTGLFSGGMYDPGASAFYYLRKKDKNGFAVLVPQEEAVDSPFAIPTTHPLCQIFGRGEKWHPRSRAPTIDVDPEVKVGCKNGSKIGVGKVGTAPQRFQLAVTPQQFEEKFQYYMKNCVVNLKA